MPGGPCHIPSQGNGRWPENYSPGGVNPERHPHKLAAPGVLGVKGNGDSQYAPHLIKRKAAKKAANFFGRTVTTISFRSGLEQRALKR